MKRTQTLLKLSFSVLVILMSVNGRQAFAELSDLSTSPLVTSASTSVKPNIMFILDDSGSMGWDYLPDWANDNDPVTGNSYDSIPKLHSNSDFNGLAYNPAITYIVPTKYNSDGTINTTTYKSKTSANTSAWTAVPNDGYGVQSSSTSNLVGNAYYHKFVAGEYCTAENLRSCTTANSASASYPYAANLRWCTDSTMSSCQALWYSGSHEYPRYAGKPAVSTIIISGSSSTSVSGITVNGKQIMSSSTTADNDRRTVAQDVVDRINNCTANITGSCTVAGYSASRSSSTITILAPDSSGLITYTPTVTQSGGMSISTNAFSGGAPGSIIRVNITSSITSYPYPNTTVKASSRTDCAGTTCTYAEEMTNYANWWSYYRTRMQMMKTSVSNAFAPIGSDYRVGYVSLNNNTDSDFLNVKDFNTSHKNDWYSEIFAAIPSSGTGLRATLSNVGRMYAGKLTTFNSQSVTDPIQYSCQQNFSILSTDGYWNGNAGVRLNGTTAVGNWDATEPRPYNDGGTVTYQKSTSQQTQSQTQLVENTSQLSKTTEQLTRVTAQTQQRIQQIQSRTQQFQSRTQQFQSRTIQYQRCKSNGTSCQDITSCSEVTSSRPSCKTNDSGWLNIGSCTPSSPSGGPETTCRTTSDTGWINVGSCTAAAPSNGPTVTCKTTSDTGWVNASSCTSSAPSSGPTITCNTTDTGFVNAASCTASSGGGQTITCNIAITTTNVSSCSASSPTPGLVITCPIITTGPDPVASCTADNDATGDGRRIFCSNLQTGPTPVASCTNATANSGNNYTQKTCSTNTVSPAVPVASCTPVSATSLNSYTATNCPIVTSGPTTVTSCAAESASTSNNFTSTTCSAATSSGGVSDTLADVAQYYYVNDLRTTALNNCTGTPVAPATTGNTLCSATVPDPYNNVPSSGLDENSAQHMTTFTLGLGIPGYMQFNPNYLSATSGDFYDVKSGTSPNPENGVCAWQSSGTCNWPVPSSDSQANIDDLWHAAINGRGSYFSAGNPAALGAGLSSALAGVSARTGAAAAATTSNPNVTSGDNFLFSSTFTTQNWDGELVRQQLDLDTGVASATIDWAAQALLDSNNSRSIYTYDSGATNKLKIFNWSNLSSSEQAYFISPHIATLSQFCASGPTCLTAASQTSASGENLVNFIRGNRTLEGASTDLTKYYRQRSHILGDIVNAEAVYVKGSLFSYADLGYADFVATNATRLGMVYAASNDGMLHAFYATDSTGITGGAEAWAYIPSAVMPNLYKLADKNYGNLHQYFVDGTPVVGDICTSNCSTTGATWKTILIGGLNGGGRGYYALDITTPTSPKVLWEFTNTNLGYTYGNPVITKLANGTWVVIVSSGYNNVSPGDGQGRLFVINAATGALDSSVNPSGSIPGTIATGFGSSTTTFTGCSTAPCPSGLAKIAVRVSDPSTNNMVTEVYGGDMYGNLWRFDVNDTIGAAGYEAHKLAVLQGDGPDNNLQPITSRPELGEVSNVKVVYVGTGRYLGSSDLSNTTDQSIYAIKDAGDTTTFTNPRSYGNFVEQVLTTTTCPSGTSSAVCSSGQIVRTSTSNPVNFSTDNGWFIDLPDSGERANTDPILALGTLGFTTNVPNTNACTVGGYSYRYFLDYRTGAPVSTANGVVSTKLGNALATRPVFVRLPNNTVVDLTRLSDGKTVTSNVPIGNGSTATRRTSWRELITE